MKIFYHCFTTSEIIYVRVSKSLKTLFMLLIVGVFLVFDTPHVRFWRTMTMKICLYPFKCKILCSHYIYILPIV